MFARCFLTAAVAVGSLVSSAALANEGCNRFYEVKPGDTLTKIARRVYGDDDSDRIYEANRATIGRNAWLIEVGASLWIPCKTDAVFAAAVGVDAGEKLGPTAGRPPLRVLAGPVRAPLIGPELPRGGMLAEMFDAAGSHAGFARGTIAHAPVAGARLAALLGSGGFDLGYPWSRADCEALSAAEGREACEGLVYSDPVFEIEMGVYARPDSRYAAAVSFADLSGARLCRPVTATTEDLLAVGLVTTLDIVRLDTEEACLTHLREGRVDLVSVDAGLAALLLEKNGWRGEVARLPIATGQVLFAAAPGDHPEGRAIIDAINAGLRRLRLSGEWFVIAHRHMAQAMRLAGRAQPRG